MDGDEKPLCIDCEFFKVCKAATLGGFRSGERCGYDAKTD